MIFLYETLNLSKLIGKGIILFSIAEELLHFEHTIYCYKVWINQKKFEDKFDLGKTKAI